MVLNKFHSEKYFRAKHLFCWFAVFVQFQFCFSQEPFVRKISYVEGIPSEVIYDLYISKSGLLYLGTDKGLISYDGVLFKKKPFKENLGNSITSIQEDASGMIWCKNFANQVFNYKNGFLEENKDIKEVIDENKANLVDIKVVNEHVWFITQNRIYHIYKNKKPNLIYKFSEANKLNEFVSIDFNTKDNHLYVSTKNNILFFSDNKFVKSQTTVEGNKILVIYKDQLSYYFKTTDKETWIGDRKVGFSEELKNVYFNKLTSIDDKLWLCTNDGIYSYDDDHNKFTGGFLKEKRITNIVQDFEKNYWISTLDEGLFILPDIDIKTIQLKNLELNLAHNFTKISNEYRGYHYFGTSKGLILEVDKNSTVNNIYDTKSNNAIEFIGFSEDRILTSYGYFYIGKNELITIPFYYAKDVVEDDRENFLVATNNFSALISKNVMGKPNIENGFGKYEIKDIENSNISYLILRNKRSRALLFDKYDRKYYVGHIDGLFVYDSFGNEKEIKLKDGKPIIASEISLDPEGNIWVASIQNGLIKIKNKEVVKILDTDDNLSSNNCRKIEIDESGIWIITDNGFDYFDFKNQKIKNAGLNICLKGITINDINVNERHITLATNEEIYYINKKVINEKSKFKFKFTDLIVNGKEVDINQNLEFTSKQNNINIKFRTIHFKSLGNYTYQYRLANDDDDDDDDEKWFSQNSTVNNVNYLALNPGNYTFEIRVKIDQEYSEVYSINFKINKPYYQQLWFLTIIFLALISLLYLVYRWAEIKTKKSQELKEQLALSQLTALRSQMNPHFMFNVLNAVQGLIYSNQKSKATDYLGKFSDLMRKILDISDKKEVTIANEFETIDLYISLEKARFEEDFEYKIIFPENVDLNRFIIPSMIIQPFVENAIKHGLMHKEGEKKLEIKVEILNDIWCFTIDDNGIGRKASEIINQKIKKHISFATKAIENRVKLINKTTGLTIDVETIDKKSKFDEPLGTRIKIYIPIIEI